MSRARWVVLVVILGVALALGAVLVPLGPTLWRKLSTKTIMNPRARVEGGIEIATAVRWNVKKLHGFARQWNLTIGEDRVDRFMTEGHFVNGEPHGITTLYFDDGRVFSQTRFDHGTTLWTRFAPPWVGDVKTKEEVMKLFRGE